MAVCHAPGCNLSQPVQAGQLLIVCAVACSPLPFVTSRQSATTALAEGVLSRPSVFHGTRASS